MFRMLTLMAVLTAGMFIWSGIGSAETVQGRIVEIDPNQKSLTLNRMDSATGQPEQVELAIDNETLFQGGVDSLNALKVGDEVSIDADQNFVTRQWTANSIQKGSLAPGQQGAGAHQAGAPQTGAGSPQASSQYASQSRAAAGSGSMQGSAQGGSSGAGGGNY